MQTRRLLLAMLLCMLWLTGFAQKTVTGTVKDATGEPMIGLRTLMVILASLTLVHRQFSKLPISVTKSRRKP